VTTSAKSVWHKVLIIAFGVFHHEVEGALRQLSNRDPGGTRDVGKSRHRRLRRKHSVVGDVATIF
jgi:hypothetical protein